MSKWIICDGLRHWNLFAQTSWKILKNWYIFPNLELVWEYFRKKKKREKNVFPTHVKHNAKCDQLYLGFMVRLFNAYAYMTNTNELLKRLRVQCLWQMGTATCRKCWKRQSLEFWFLPFRFDLYEKHIESNECSIYLLFYWPRILSSDIWRIYCLLVISLTAGTHFMAQF